MMCSLHTPVKVVAGLFVAALSALPQYTISAKPGVINTIEGTAYVNGKPVTDAKAAARMFLEANDTLSTDAGKAEVLLTPGVFLRLGDHSEVKMISPALTKTKIEVTKGQAIVEVAEILKENDIEVAVAGATATIEKVGLYEFKADSPAVASVLEGKVSVELGDKTVALGKDHQTLLTGQLKSEHFKGKDDQSDLYAWSRTRDEFDSAASYASAKTLATTLSASSYAGGGYGYNNGFGYGGGSLYSGFNGGMGAGWMWNPMFNSYAWLPGDGASFSPFGYGYFAPGYVSYAPVVYSSLGGITRGGGVAVPVNPNHLPVAVAASPHPAVMTATGRPYNGSYASAVMTGVGTSSGHVSSRTFTAAASSAQAAAPMSSGTGGGNARSVSSASPSMAPSGGSHSSGGSPAGGHR